MPAKNPPAARFAHTPVKQHDIATGHLAILDGQHIRILVDCRENFGNPQPWANLIASAPDLLEACKVAERNLAAAYSSEHFVMQKLRAAIAAAEQEATDHA